MGRRDAKLMKDIGAMTYIMPFMYPNRCDNETFFSFQIDLTNLNEYIKKKNADNPNYKYNMFQCIIAATLKTVTLRSRLNSFIHDRKVYMRNEVTTSFVVKQEFADDGREVLAFIHSKPEWTIDDLHNELESQLLKLRDREYKDESSDFMDMFNKLPMFISRPALKFVCWLEKKSMIPHALIETDPYHSSVVFANLGSIGLPEGYHHLTNWGTTSIFVVVGQSGRMPFYENDQVVFKDGVRLNFTIDERIGDGYYFARSIAMLKYFLENPEYLDKPFKEKLDDEIYKTLTVR